MGGRIWGSVSVEKKKLHWGVHIQMYNEEDYWWQLPVFPDVDVKTNSSQGQMAQCSEDPTDPSDHVKCWSPLQHNYERTEQVWIVWKGCLFCLKRTWEHGDVWNNECPRDRWDESFCSENSQPSLLGWTTHSISTETSYTNSQAWKCDNSGVFGKT